MSKEREVYEIIKAAGKGIRFADIRRRHGNITSSYLSNIITRLRNRRCIDVEIARNGDSIAFEYVTTGDYHTPKNRKPFRMSEDGRNAVMYYLHHNPWSTFEEIMDATKISEQTLFLYMTLMLADGYITEDQDERYIPTSNGEGYMKSVRVYAIK